MKKRTKVDPQVAKLQRQVASQSVSEKIHVSITVGKRVVAYASVTPSNRGEAQRLKANRHKSDPEDSAFKGSIINDGERRELFAQVEVDGAVLCYDIGKFGRSIDYAWLRINNRCMEKIYSKEGLTNLIAAGDLAKA